MRTFHLPSSERQHSDHASGPTVGRAGGVDVGSSVGFQGDGVIVGGAGVVGRTSATTVATGGGHAAAGRVGTAVAGEDLGAAGVVGRAAQPISKATVLRGIQ